MKPGLFSVSVKPVPFPRRWLRLLWTESHIPGDRNTGKRRAARTAGRPPVDSRLSLSEADRHRQENTVQRVQRARSQPQPPDFAGRQTGASGPCQAAEVISAACQIIQTKPPHDASDNISRTQRAMTASPCVFRLCSMFPLRSGQAYLR